MYAKVGKDVRLLESHYNNAAEPMSQTGNCTADQFEQSERERRETLFQNADAREGNNARVLQFSLVKS